MGATDEAPAAFQHPSTWTDALRLPHIGQAPIVASAAETAGCIMLHRREISRTRRDSINGRSAMASSAMAACSS